MIATAIGLYAEAASGLADYVWPGNRVPAAQEMVIMPDGVTYASTSADGKRITLHDMASGKETGVLFDSDASRESKLKSFESFSLSPDGGKLLILASSEGIYRRSIRGQYYVYEVRSRILRPLSEGHKVQQSPLFSPDSRMVAFVAGGNIYIKKIDYNTEVAVTKDGAPGKVINGVPDWTYEEEFATTCSMAWSPDSQTLSYLRYDESAVPLYRLPLYEGACDPMKQYALYPGELTYKYPVAGEPNSRVTLRSYNIETRKDWGINLPGSQIEYIPRIAFGPGADKLIAVTLNREQNRMEVYAVNPRSAVASSIIVEENTNAWLNPATYEDIALLPHAIVLQSERTGFNHLYEYTYEGALQGAITSGDFDVMAFYGYDSAKQQYWIQSTKSGPANRVVSRVDAKGKITDVTSAVGTGSAEFGPGMKMAVVTHSTAIDAPTVTVRDSGGKVLRTVTDNKAYAAKYASDPQREFFEINAGATTLCCMMVRPANFDPTVKYPVIINQYSGPGSQQVLNVWNPDWTLWYAKQGYAVITIDPRGTGGRGRSFMDGVYRRLGQLETTDLISATRKLCAEYSWMDVDRIGIYGWSYGGFEALMCATEPGTPFKATVAVAPVTSWRLYDTAYTERYMLTPGQNPDGYDRCAPLNRVHDASGSILLMWGTADDNVHPANSLEFVARLESLNRWADILVFPNQNHLIKGCSLRETVYARMLDYFNKNL